jgi:hypothetical protein
MGVSLGTEERVKTPFFKHETEEGAWRLMSVRRTIHNSTRAATGSALMDVHHTPTEVTESCERHNYARVPGRWLLLARVGWVGLVILTLAIFGASLPVYVALLQTPCAGTACQWDQPTPGQAGALTGMGLSLGDYAAYTVALMLASMLICLVVSTLIVWRRSDDRRGLLVALLLMLSCQCSHCLARHGRKPRQQQA